MFCRQQTPINFRKIQGTILFRSSRPCGGELGASYCSRGIKTVCDLRLPSEISTETGLTKHYDTFCLAIDKNGDVTERQVAASKCVQEENSDPKGKHVLISLVSHSSLFCQAPFLVKIRLVFAYIWDFIFGTRYGYKIMARKVIGAHGDQSLIRLYQHIVDKSGQEICATLKLLCRRERVPAIICCSMGKDRTGVMCALVGHVCNRTREQIADDYALTQECYDKEPGHEILDEVKCLGLPQTFKDAPRDVMLDLFQYIEGKYGSLEGYLDGIGFGAEERAALRANVMCLESGQCIS